MRKIFGILVTLMVIGLTFMSCKPTTGDTKNGTGSSTGIDTTVPPISNDSGALKKFIKETFDDFNQSDKKHMVYSGKIKNTNDYVLIPAKAAVPNSFSKIDDNKYSFGNAKLIKESVNGMNIYLYTYGDYFLFYDGAYDGDYTISMTNYMWSKYFDGENNFSEFIKIGEETFNIVY